MKKFSKGQIAKSILIGVVLAGAAISVVALPGLPQVIKLFGIGKKNNYRLYQSTYRLKKKKYIKISNFGGRLTIKITPQGQKRLSLYNFEDIRISGSRRQWDGKWRIVIFDIPESKKKIRDYFHKKLKDLNFFPLQKSIMAYPFECKNEINSICVYLKIQKHVKYILAESVMEDEELKNFFTL